MVSLAESWHAAQRCLYTASPETAATQGSTAVKEMTAVKEIKGASGAKVRKSSSHFTMACMTAFSNSGRISRMGVWIIITATNVFLGVDPEVGAIGAAPAEAAV